MTFYKFFKNKKDIAQAILTYIFDESVQKYRDIMQLNIPFEEKIRMQIKAKHEGTKEISKELIKDIYADNKLGLKEYWQKRTDEFTQEVYSNFAKAQKEGVIRKDMKLDFVFYFSSVSMNHHKTRFVTVFCWIF